MTFYPSPNPSPTGEGSTSHNWRRQGVILGVLLLGFGLLIYRLGDIPPGMTHDEAAHGWEAVQILEGSPRYYFPLGYGREPLYGYLLAGVMGAIGVSPLGLRLVIPWAMVLALAGGYRWGRDAFGQPAALLGVAAWAVGFWPIAAGRQALRSGLVPLLMILIAIGTWQLLFPRSNRGRSPSPWPAALLVAVSIGLLLHTYIAARLLWALPLFFLLALWLTGRPAGGASARLLLVALALGLALGAPLFVYLQLNPGLESRLDMLSRPLTALLQGDVTPLLNNSWAAVKALVWPGAGDRFLAYNVPGRPTLEPVAAVLAVIGLGVGMWRWRHPAYIYTLLWLGVGLAPSLITGPTANTTRNIGALPALYLLVGIGGWALLHRLPAGWWRSAAGVAIIAAIAGSSVPTYFGSWGTAPEVRAAYRATTVSALREVEMSLPPGQPAVISTELPGPAHDPLLADLVLRQPARPLRWVDARRALLFPAGERVDVFAPQGAEVHHEFAGWGEVVDQTALSTGDLEPLVTHYRLAPLDRPGQPINEKFGEAITLLGAHWLADEVPPGGVGELLTIWQVEDPEKLPPAFPVGFLDLAIFVHVLDQNGEIIFQEDRLDAPPATWLAGDVLVQIHQVFVTPTTALGVYSGRIGLYDRATGVRLQVTDGRDGVELPPFSVK